MSTVSPFPAGSLTRGPRPTAPLPRAPRPAVPLAAGPRTTAPTLFDRVAHVSPRLTVPGMLLGALLLGLLASRDISLGLAAAGGLVFAMFLLLDLPVAIGIWVLALSLAGVPGTNGAPTGTSVLLLAGWAGTLADRGTSNDLMRVRWALAATGAMLLWSTLSILWAADGGAATKVVQQWWIAAAVLPVLVTAVRDVRDVLVILGAFVAGATACVVVGVMTGSTAAPTDAIAAAEAAAGRLNVGITDPNYLAANIVASLAIIVGLLGVRQIRAWRPWLIAAIPVLLYGLVATQSRGGIMALSAAAILAAVVLRDYRRWIAIGVSGVVVLLIGFLALQPHAVERLTQSDSTGTGRTDIWRVAGALSQDHLALGVGTGNFALAKSGYADQVGFIERPGLIIDAPLVAHNLWLQALGENGLPGLLLIVAVLVACVHASFTAGRRFAVADRPDLANAARALAVGQLASLVASIFIANGNDRILWVLLALGPALLVVSPGPRTPPKHRNAR